MRRKTNTIAFLIAIVCIILIGSYYVNRPYAELQEGLQISRLESKKIHKILTHFDITVSRISAIEKNEKGFSAYQLIDEKEKKYILIFQNEKRSYSALLDENGRLLDGIVDYDLDLGIEKKTVHSLMFLYDVRVCHSLSPLPMKRQRAEI